MSTFKVKLNNGSQESFDPSIQRTVYVAGPRGIRRLLKDGDIFTDCNYWKRFAYPQMLKQDAFIEVISDDGSIYSDVPEENNFPRVYTLNVANGSSYEDNRIDILGDNEGAAGFVQINNFSSSGTVKIKINNSNNAIFDLEPGSIQQFNNGDISITRLDFKNESGTDATVQVILSVINKPKS